MAYYPIDPRHAGTNCPRLRSIADLGCNVLMDVVYLLAAEKPDPFISVGNADSRAIDLAERIERLAGAENVLEWVEKAQGMHSDDCFNVYLKAKLAAEACA
jgi:hypothetical protein